MKREEKRKDSPQPRRTYVLLGALQTKPRFPLHMSTVTRVSPHLPPTQDAGPPRRCPSPHGFQAGVLETGIKGMSVGSPEQVTLAEGGYEPHEKHRIHRAFYYYYEFFKELRNVFGFSFSLRTATSGAMALKSPCPEQRSAPASKGTTTHPVGTNRGIQPLRVSLSSLSNNPEDLCFI